MAYAQTACHWETFLADLKRDFRAAPTQIVAQPQCTVFRTAFENDAIFLPAQAPGKLGDLGRLAGDPLDDEVPDRMAKGVIDALEVVDIQENGGKRIGLFRLRMRASSRSKNARRL